MYTLELLTYIDIYLIPLWLIMKIRFLIAHNQGQKLAQSKKLLSQSYHKQCSVYEALNFENLFYKYTYKLIFREETKEKIEQDVLTSAYVYIMTFI